MNQEKELKGIQDAINKDLHSLVVPSFSKTGDEYLYPYDGLLKDIQEKLMESSTHRQPAIALAAAMCAMSGSFGQLSRYENVKGNFYFVCIAESGEGKDRPCRFVRKVVGSVKGAAQVIGKVASTTGMFDALEASENKLVMVIDEFGNYINQVNSAGGTTHEKEMINLTTEMFTSTTDIILKKTVKGAVGEAIKEPFLSLFGATTSLQFFEKLSDGALSDGSLARYSYYFGLRGVEMKPHKPADEADKQVVSMLEAERHERVLKLKAYKRTLKKSKRADVVSYPVPRNQEIEDFKFVMLNKIKKRYCNGSTSTYSSLYNRATMKAIASALLVDGLSNIETVRWFLRLELMNAKVFIRRHQEMGSNSDLERNNKKLLEFIRSSGAKGISRSLLTRKTQFLTSSSRQIAIAELIDNGLVREERRKVGLKSRPTDFLIWM